MIASLATSEPRNIADPQPRHSGAGYILLPDYDKQFAFLSRIYVGWEAYLEAEPQPQPEPELCGICFCHLFRVQIKLSTLSTYLTQIYL